MPHSRPVPIPAAGRAEAVRVLSAAFHDYPVMRYVLGPEGDYDRRLHTLITLFADGRFSRGEPALGLYDEANRMVGVALVTPPGVRPPPPAFLEHREAAWGELGADARGRYDAFVEACNRFPVAEPHYHLNMIGVVPSRAGTGLGRVLLESVQQLSLGDSGSTGVSLTTENPDNLPLYRHFGYQIMGQARVSPSLETWVFFRADGGPGPAPGS